MHFFKGKLPEKILRHIGLVRLDNSSTWEVFYWLTPEVTVFPIVLILYLVIRKSTRIVPKDELDTLSLQQETADKERNSKVLFLITINLLNRLNQNKRFI